MAIQGMLNVKGRDEKKAVFGYASNGQKPKKPKEVNAEADGFFDLVPLVTGQVEQ